MLGCDGICRVLVLILWGGGGGGYDGDVGGGV